MPNIVKTLSVPSSLCAAIAASTLCVAPIACDDKAKTEGKASADSKDSAKKAEPEKTVAEDPANPTDAKKPGNEGTVDLAKHVASVVAGPRDITPSYSQPLDPMLDLVPADADTFIIIRDLGAFVEGTLGYLEASKASLGLLASEIEKTDPADADELRENLDKVVAFEKALTASGIDLSAGAVIAGRHDDDGHSIVLYGSAKADALPTLLTTVGATGDVPKHCTLVASAAGYAVCSKVDTKGYAPGSKAASLRKMLESELPGVDLNRANIVAHFTDDEGNKIPIAVETGQGMAHIAFAVPQTRKQLGKYLQASRGAGLGLIGAGQPFLWAQGSKAEIEAAGEKAPAMAQNMVKTLTGEVIIGGIEGAKGFATLIGLTDPAPAAGLVALASLGLGEVPKELPDGTKIEATVKTVRGAQAVHVKFEGGKQAKFLKEMDYASEVFAFAAGHYAAATVGATEDVVEKVSTYKGSGPSATMLAALPAPLATALEAGEPAFAMYVPFDALQAASASRIFEAISGELPAGEFSKTNPKKIMQLSMDLLAPLSSTSVWISHLDEGPVFHAVVQGFAEAGTAEGRAAFGAIAAVGSGADRTSTYAALARKYPASPRVSSYKSRAGELGDAFASLFVVGAIGGAGAGLWLGTSAVSSPIAVEAADPAVPPSVKSP